MKSLTSVMSFRLRVGILTSVIALVAMCTHCDAQPACGMQTGTVCPFFCGYPNPGNYQGAQYGGFNLNSYVITAIVFCGDTCGYQEVNVTNTSCYPGGDSKKALNEQVFRELRQLAGERDILVPGCNGSFQSVKPVFATALRPRDPAMTDLALAGFPSIRIEW
jgi:hypothetical protein